LSSQVVINNLAINSARPKSDLPRSTQVPSGSHRCLRYGRIAVAVWLALVASEGRAQIEYTLNSKGRSVNCSLFINGNGPQSKAFSDAPTSPFAPFHGNAGGMLSSSGIDPNTGHSLSEMASGQGTEDSVLTSTSIISSGSGNFSGQVI